MARGCRVRAVFIRMLYLAIQSSYGRFDTGFEHYARGAMHGRGKGGWIQHGERVDGGGVRKESEGWRDTTDSDKQVW